MSVHDLAHDGQAESRSRLLGREEWSENPLQNGTGYAATGVADSNPDIVSFQRGRHRDGTAVFKSMNSIEKEVVEHLHQLIGIAEDFGNRRIQFGLDLDLSLLNLQSQPVEGLAQDVMEVRWQHHGLLGPRILQ